MKRIKQMTYIDVVEGMFSESGALVQIGGRYNENQSQYAMVIAKALDSKNAMALCEANTGIGKSLAYLIPSMVYLAMHEDCDPILVSTYTRALQRQLLDKDIGLASKALEHQELKIPLTAFRMGRNAFLSPTRAREAVNAIRSPMRGSEHDRFLEFVDKTSLSGSGLWMDYINEYGTFPKGINTEDICLLSLMESDNPAYDQHLVNADNAKLLITNHASVINPKLFNSKQFHAVICDEAHEIEEACKSASTHKSQLKRIASAILETSIKTKSAMSAVDIAIELEKKLKKIDLKELKNESLISDISNSRVMNDIQPDVIALTKLVTSTRNRYVSQIDGSANTTEADISSRLDKHIETLTSFERGSVKNRRRAIAFSHLLREPSIATVSLNAGGIFNYRAKLLTNRVVLVSATISNANSKTISFTQLLGALNIKANTVTDQCSISPKNFGEMDFVTVPFGRSPVIKNDDDFALDGEWIKRTVSMINKASLSGKTLVLSPSMKESRLLSKGIRGDYLLQTPTKTLMQLTKRFVEGEEKVLLSSGAWNGVSFRNSNGGQLIKNLVITRIPFAPADPEQRYLQVEWLASQGYSKDEIDRILWTRQQYSAMLKLKQGIGRGIRSPSDKIKVWFADPRMPKIGNSSGLIAAIPTRFIEKYRNADIFDGEDTQEAEPFIYI